MDQRGHSIFVGLINLEMPWCHLLLHVCVCISNWPLDISLPCSLVHFNCVLIFMSIWAFQRVSLSTWMCIHLLNQKSSKLFLNFVLYFAPKWFKVELCYYLKLFKNGWYMNMKWLGKTRKDVCISFFPVSPTTSFHFPDENEKFSFHRSNKLTVSNVFSRDLLVCALSIFELGSCYVAHAGQELEV